MTPVFTGGQRCLCTPVIIRLVNTAVFTGARYTLPVFTGRVEGPYSQVEWTGAREHGLRTRVCIELYYPVFTRATLAGADISCRRMSVCLSVRLSQVGVLLKRLNVGSRIQRRI